MMRQSFSWGDVDRLRREFDRLFDGSVPRIYRQRSRTFPAINIWTNEEEGVIVTAELPGLKSEDVNLTVTKDTLTISGDCQPMEKPESGGYHRQEKTYGKFNREIQLPYTVDNDKVNASLEKGVLQITLPRAEAEKPKQLAVKAAG